jgi:hypothetical protein
MFWGGTDDKVTRVTGFTLIDIHPGNFAFDD